MNLIDEMSHHVTKNKKRKISFIGFTVKIGS